jgi:hypothetical protein
MSGFKKCGGFNGKRVLLRNDKTGEDDKKKKYRILQTDPMIKKYAEK